MTRLLLIALAASSALVLVWLVPDNRRALAGILRTPSSRRRDAAFRRALLAWALSLTALVSGPAAPIFAAIGAGVARGASRLINTQPYPDPEDVHLVKTARKNALAAFLLVITIAVAAVAYSYMGA